MANTSATGGTLTPTTTSALYDDALVDFLQGVFVGLSGLDGSYVRPAYQLLPPKQPDIGVTWCAVAVQRIDRDANPVLAHVANGLGQDNMQRHEEIHVLLSCYGPGASGTAARVADGLALGQNNDSLSPQLMSYVNTDTIRQVSELVNQQWIPRFDVSVKFRRQVKRTYAVQNLVSADVKNVTVTFN